NADAALADLYLQGGRTQEGLQKLDEVTKKNPNNATVYIQKGLIYERDGKIPEAKDNYSRALQIDGTADVAANNLAYILAEEGVGLAKGETWAKDVKKRQPENPGIADTLGWVYYKLGNYVSAQEQLNFAISKEPSNPEFQYHLGMIYKDKKDLN